MDQATENAAIEKHTLIDEIKEGLHAIEAFSEEVINKVAAFFEMKKLQVTQSATGEEPISNDYIVDAVQEADQADKQEAAAKGDATTSEQPAE